MEHIRGGSDQDTGSGAPYDFFGWIDLEFARARKRRSVSAHAAAPARQQPPPVLEHAERYGWSDSVRFTAEWDGALWPVLVPRARVAADAGKPLDRAAAARYVQRHRDKYVEAARETARRQRLRRGHLVRLGA